MRDRSSIMYRLNVLHRLNVLLCGAVASFWNPVDSLAVIASPLLICLLLCYVNLEGFTCGRFCTKHAHAR